MSPVGRAGAWQLVLPLLRDEPARPPGTGPPGWLPVAGRRPPRPRRVAGRHRGGPHRRRLDGRAVATALAGHPHEDPAHHPVPLHPRRRQRPHPPPRPLPPGRPRRPVPPDCLRPDRRRHQPQRPAAVRLGDAAPTHHPAGSTQPRRPRRHHRVQPCPAHRDHRRRQLDQREQAIEAGQPWTDSGYVFTRPDGQPINPNYATTRFRKLVQRAELPPVRLHDLRHGAASLAHQAGADLKTLQDLLGHSSIVITADTYTTVLPQVQRQCADATAHLVLTAARHTRKKIKIKAWKNRPTRRPKTGAPAPTAPAAALNQQFRASRREESTPKAAAPTSHPCDTHCPQQPENTRGLTRVSAGQTPCDLARPKGLEPLTF
ncbi:tyrosine-type recombinase/integrase [Micromonospora sp. NPDC023956]|uniref:tyrosine-type recombinase/integrase n=1 Tax=Micromonospora sp. NPDC023956 TaxID=3155722 RepID=UPI0033FFFC63